MVLVSLWLILGQSLSVGASKSRYTNSFLCACSEIHVSARGIDGAYSEESYENRVRTREGTTATEKGEVGAYVENAWVTDLDRDQNFEVIILARSAGSGAYGDLLFFEWEGTEFKRRHLPPLAPEWNQSYMGHDRFCIEGNRIVREFPVYREDDCNAYPSGGTRRVIYRYEKGRIVVLKSEKVTVGGSLTGCSHSNDVPRDLHKDAFLEPTIASAMRHR